MDVGDVSVSKLTCRKRLYRIVSRYPFFFILLLIPKHGLSEALTSGKI